jgi:hypothetical protein
VLLFVCLMVFKATFTNISVIWYREDFFYGENRRQVVEVNSNTSGPSWPWSYGSWIYNYLCNQCLSPLMLWVRISIRVRCTTLCDKVCQWLAIGLWFSPGPSVFSIKKIFTISYNWNIGESGFKHHQTNKQ